MNEQDWENRVSYHPALSDATKNAHEAVRNIIKYAGINLSRYVPEGREFALMLTKLEEAMFWANAGIARN